MSSKILKIVEYSTGFAIHHIPSSDDFWLGDGINVFFDENDVSLPPGSPNFIERWQTIVDENEHAFLDLFFPYYVNWN